MSASEIERGAQAYAELESARQLQAIAHIGVEEVSEALVRALHGSALADVESVVLVAGGDVGVAVPFVVVSQVGAQACLEAALAAPRLEVQLQRDAYAVYLVGEVGDAEVPVEIRNKDLVFRYSSVPVPDACLLNG